MTEMMAEIAAFDGRTAKIVGPARSGKTEALLRRAAAAVAAGCAPEDILVETSTAEAARVARRRLGCKKSEMAMVCDQIFADRMAAGLYGCPCLDLMPRTNHDKNKFVLLKRKFEPYWIDKYYQKGGKLYE